MSIIIILIGYYFDYKSGKTAFIRDLQKGLSIVLMLLVSALVLISLFGFSLLSTIFSIGIEIIVLFSLKAYFNKKH